MSKNSVGTIIKIDLGDGEECTLSPRISAAVLHAARHRRKSPAHIIRLALSQKIRLLEEEHLAGLAQHLKCSRQEATTRAVLFMSAYLRAA